MKYKINKQKCIGCGTCVAVCPKGFRLGPDGKSEVIDSAEAHECGGTQVCPFGAIEEDSSKD